jgi:1-acyl-sn-glycerol-3-phosphate acyltransferase
MGRTFIFFFIFWIGLFISFFFIIPYFILNLRKNKDLRRRYIKLVTSEWSKFTLFTAGMTVNASGMENIPNNNSGYVLISNHESNFDILVLMATLPFSPAFVAKKELMRFPFIRSWMKAMECLPIDRKNPRESRKKICHRIQKEGMNELVLFPEGTRNRGKGMKNFKTGSLKLMFHNQIEMLPVTIKGTHKAYEENNNIQPAEVNLFFHPLIRTSDYQRKDFPKFLEDLQKVISHPLDRVV